jgi:hypothetical protein
MTTTVPCVWIAACAVPKYRRHARQTANSFDIRKLSDVRDQLKQQFERKLHNAGRGRGADDAKGAAVYVSIRLPFIDTRFF